jgi:hypothetical protein
MFRLTSCWCGLQALKHGFQKAAIVSYLQGCGVFADLSVLILTIWVIFPIANTVKDVIALENAVLEKVPSVLCCNTL